MNILVYGAGVIGSVYATRLQEAGYAVSLLARGKRAVSLRAQGVVLEKASTGQRTTTQVSVVEHLAPTDSYDVVIVTVRLDQLASILPDLAANHQIPIVLFMLSNPAGMQRLEMLEAHRVVIGFPSVNGTQQGDVIRYMIAPRPASMTLGEPDGRVTPRIRQLATIFKKAGFSVGLNSDMQAWLKTHALLDLGVLAAIVMTKGTSAQLGRTRKNVVMMVKAINEGLLALQAQDIPIMPFSMKVLFLWMPRWLVVMLFQSLLQTPTAALGIDNQFDSDNHLNTGVLKERHEMAREMMAQLQTSPLATPTLSRLIEFLEMPTEAGRV